MFKLTTLAVRVTLCNIHVSTFTHCLRVHDWRPRQSLHVYVWIFIHVGAFKSQCPWQMSTSKPACLSLNIYPCRSFHISMSMTDNPYPSLHVYDWIFIHVGAFTSQCPWLTIHVQACMSMTEYLSMSELSHLNVWIFIHVGAFKSQCPWLTSTTKPACLCLNIYSCWSFQISMFVTRYPCQSFYSCLSMAGHPS